MCGVIVVDPGRSQSANLGCDAYIHDHCLGYRHNYFCFYQLPNGNLFTHHLLFFSREATSETYRPRVFFLIYLVAIYFSFAFLFRSIKPKKYKNTLLQFILIYFIRHSIYQYTTNLPHVRLPILRRRTPEGIDNPFNTPGCGDLLSVYRGCLRCVAWFSYWFDTLVS